jgi:hypothetical protein
MENIEDQFDKWTQQWDKALKDGVFPPTKPAEPVGKSNFFGQTQVDDSKLDPEDKEVSYWNDIAHYSESESYELLTEAKKKKVVDKDVAEKAKKVAKSSNPVDYTNLGKDAKNVPTEDWGSGENINKLTELKKKLFDLEVKFLSKHAVGNNEKEVDSAKKEMEEVSKMIDDISDKMTSLRFSPEPK